MRRILILIACCLSLGVLTLTAAAQEASALLENADGQNDQYSAIGRLNFSSACTATFFDTAPADPTTAPAYVITNGHCADAWSANEVLTGEAVENASMTFRYFVDTVDQQLTFAIAELAYSTMKSVDIAILALDATYAEVTDAGITPLTFGEAPEIGAAVRVIGAPNTGIPEDEAYLRAADCTINRQVDVIEGHWHFLNVYANDCADIRGGSSGSPVLNADGQITALINTTTQSATLPGCYYNHPCEITSAGALLQPDTSYATRAEVLTCFTDGVFDLNREGCALDPGASIQISGTPRASQPFITQQDGSTFPAAWNAELTSETFTHYRYKIGGVSEADCTDPDFYSEPLSLQTASVIPLPLPDVEGYYFLCALGTDAAGEADQPAQFASAVHVRVDMTPPTISLLMDISADEDAYRVTALYQPPEISLFAFKSGPLGTVDCDDPDDYVVPRVDFIRLPRDQAPYTVCAIAYDDADNATQPISFILR